MLWNRSIKEQSTKPRINEVLTGVCKVATLLTLACARVPDPMEVGCVICTLTAGGMR